MKILPVILVALSVSAAHAQRQASPLWTELTVKSARLAEPRKIFVSTPAGYENPTQHFPVLVLLDADDREQFNAAIANTAFLASRSAVPRLIIVGIPNGKDRTHDLTPTALGKNAVQFNTAGGAGAFTDFIVNEALPLVRSKYRTSKLTVLAGHSFGGLVALHAAATRDAFAGIVAMSPSLWWNDTTAMRGYADSVARLSHPLRLFVTSGEYEPAIESPTHAFAARVDSIKPPGLAFAYQHYGYANHGLTPVPSLMDGLRFVFDAVSTVRSPLSLLGPDADSAAVMNAYLATRDSYAAGAKSLGMEGNLPEVDVNGMGYATLQMIKNPRLAVWLFRQNVANYPTSPNVYDSLGDGLLAMGDTAAARAAFTQALDVAKHGKLPPDPTTKKKLAELTRRP